MTQTDELSLNNELPNSPSPSERGYRGEVFTKAIQVISLSITDLLKNKLTTCRPPMGVEQLIKINARIKILIG